MEVERRAKARQDDPPLIDLDRVADRECLTPAYVGDHQPRLGID